MDAEVVTALMAVVAVGLSLYSVVRADHADGTAQEANKLSEAGNEASRNAVTEARSANVLVREANGIASRAMTASEGATNIANESLELSRLQIRTQFRSRIAVTMVSGGFSTGGTHRALARITNEGISPAYNFTCFFSSINAKTSINMLSQNYALSPGQSIQAEIELTPEDWVFLLGPCNREPRAELLVGYRDHLGSHLLKFTYTFALISPYLIQALEDNEPHMQNHSDQYRQELQKVIEDYAAQPRLFSGIDMASPDAP
jgi:hypothetical protein